MGKITGLIVEQFSLFLLPLCVFPFSFFTLHLMRSLRCETSVQLIKMALFSGIRSRVSMFQPVCFVPGSYFVFSHQDSSAARN
jgi:hypothetical protein